ncbi:MAG: DUF4157 domain-containing protein [Acidobacteriota bacterium]
MHASRPRPVTQGPDAGRPLDAPTRAAMESRLGHDFGRVRVHTGPEADRSAAELGAHAYTLGLDVHFRDGRYRPDQPAGQALLVHELEHVARAGPAGPAVPRLALDPAAGDHETQIRAILAVRNAKPQALLRYVDAHPDSLAVAETLIAGGAAGPATVKMLRALLARHPESGARVADLVRQGTVVQRQAARTKATGMWEQYTTAAYVRAVVQWTTKQRDAERAKRTPRGSRRPAGSPSGLELQYEAWRAKAQARFDGLVRAQPAALAASNSAIGAMLAAAQPVPYAQGDVLEEVADEIHSAMSDARVTRIETFEDASLLGLQATPTVTRQIAKDQATLAAKREAEAKATDARQKLDPATPGSGVFGPLTRPQTRALTRAKRAEDKAIAARKKAESALTWRGARNKEVRAFLRSQDPAERAAAEGRLQAEGKARDEALEGFLPDSADVPVFDPAALLPDDQRWWIYHTALQNVAEGFPGFSAELSVAELVASRSAVARNRTALGIDHSVSLGTYATHGEGQYDVHAPAGKDVLAVQPGRVDLRRAFRSRTPRLFELQDSKVRSATEIGPEHGDQDVLAKLVYGYFGRGWKDPKRIDDYLAGGSTGRRSPAANRIVAALVFEGALPDSPISAEVEADRKAIREKLETALRAELAAQTPAVVIPDTTGILAAVDASSGYFDSASTISPEAVEIFKAVPAARGRRAKPYGTKGKASAAVLKATAKILGGDNEVTKGVEDLIRKLWRSGAGTRSGPAVTLIHHYKEPGTGTEAWVEVDYRHLSAVEPLARGADVAPGSVIGRVGSSGNAISPHVHQAIRVYTQDPRLEPNAHVKAYLVPLEFFPFVLPGGARPLAGTPSADDPL